MEKKEKKSWCFNTYKSVDLRAFRKQKTSQGMVIQDFVAS